jgi:hypothetical protein
MGERQRADEPSQRPSRPNRSPSPLWPGYLRAVWTAPTTEARVKKRNVRALRETSDSNIVVLALGVFPRGKGTRRAVVQRSLIISSDRDPRRSALQEQATCQRKRWIGSAPTQSRHQVLSTFRSSGLIVRAYSDLCESLRWQISRYRRFPETSQIGPIRRHFA